MLKHEKRMKPLLQASASPFARVSGENLFFREFVYICTPHAEAQREKQVCQFFFIGGGAVFVLHGVLQHPYSMLYHAGRNLQSTFLSFPCEQKFLSSELNFLHGACGWMYSKSTGPSFPPASRSTACRPGMEEEEDEGVCRGGLEVREEATGMLRRRQQRCCQEEGENRLRRGLQRRRRRRLLLLLRGKHRPVVQGGRKQFLFSVKVSQRV